MSRAEDAREDIAFRMGMLGGAPSTGATTYPLAPPLPHLSGTPLSAGPVAPSPSTPPGTPGGGGSGGILGLTGGQFATALMSGGLAFMGGYQRNPGLTNLSWQMNQALGASIQRQRQQQIANARQRIMQGIDFYDEKSLKEGVQKLLDANFVEDAAKIDSQLDDLRDFKSGNMAKVLEQASPVLKQIQKVQFANQRIQQTLARPDVNYDVSKLNDFERVAIAETAVTAEMPYALSDEEYARHIRAGQTEKAINRLAYMIGLPTGAPSDEIIKQMVNRVEDNARAGNKFTRFVGERTGYDFSALTTPVKTSGIDRPSGRTMVYKSIAETAKTIPEGQKQFSEWFNQTAPGKVVDQTLDFFGF